MLAGNGLALKHPSEATTRTTGRVVDQGPRSAEAPLGFVGEPAHAELAFAIIGPSVVVQDRVDAGARAVAEGAADRAARVCVSRSEFPLGAWELAERTPVEVVIVGGKPEEIIRQLAQIMTMHFRTSTALLRTL